VYLSRLVLTGLPNATAAAVRQSVFAGVAVAQQTGSASLLLSVRSAFAGGMDVALVVSAGIAVVGLVLTLLFLPRSNALQDNQAVPPDMGRELAGIR
jgi:hypothetical protein